MESGSHPDARLDLSCGRGARPVVARRARGEERSGPPRAAGAVSLGRLSPVSEPGDRAALAWTRALSGRVPGQRAGRGSHVLRALLPPRSRRPAARQPARRQVLSARPSGHRLGFLAAGGALVVLVAVAFSVGRFPVTPAELLTVLWSRITGVPHGLPATIDTVVFNVRGPRIVAAILVGAALRAAGAAYQGLFRNQLVSPDILGVSTGAALGAVTGIYLSLGVVAIQSLAFVVGLGAVAIVYATAASLRRHDPILILVLAGIVIGTLFGSLVSLLKYLADPYNQLPAITFWLLGSLASVTIGDVRAVAPSVALGLVPLVLLRWRMNVMTLGEDEARALGVDTRWLRLVVIAAATLMTAGVVSISGVVGWIGLLVPHLARFLVGPDFRRLLPVSILLGAGYLLGVDTLARTMARIEIPLGVLTAFIGAPFFIWVLAASRRGWQ